MTSLRGFEELWRRALELNIKYYGGLGKLTADYLRDLGAVMSNAQSAPAPGGSAASAAEARPAATSAPPSQPGAPVIVLEGESGSTALGVFLVGNSLPHDVSARVTASPILDESGRQGKAAFVFDPPSISLRPGEQLLVRVTAVIDPSLEPDARYRGELSIPELGGTRIPVIIRRRPGAAKDGA
jgi:hypothetical protein